MLKLHFISLGCSKNLVDSERLLALCGELGLGLTESVSEADLIVINTCAFLESAVTEAVTHILNCAAEKKRGAKLVVVGCLPSRYQNEKIDLNEVDLFLKPADYHLFASKIKELLHLPDSRLSLKNKGLGPRQQSTPFFRAYLKIAEGCDNHCSYCLIPKIRGPLVSFAQKDLLAEAKSLVKNGVVELTLIAQDLTVYGRDLKSGENLLSLVAKLSEIKNLKWIRLLYAYPERLSPDWAKSLAQMPKVAPYLDIPFQHASPKILKMMGRPHRVGVLVQIKKLRKVWPQLALRSTMIVGFPGETDEDFQALLDLVAEAGFDHLGVFKYSREEGSPASLMKNQVPQAIKEKRRRKLMSLQRKISLAKNKERVGQIYDVLVEGPDPDSGLVFWGRASFQAPEVDGVIFFEGEQPPVGQLVKAKIIKAEHYDLLAQWLP